MFSLLVLAIVTAAHGEDFAVRVGYVKPNQTTICDNIEVACTIDTEDDASFINIEWLVNGKSHHVMNGTQFRNISKSIKCSPENLGNVTCEITSTKSGKMSKLQDTTEFEFTTAPTVTVVGDKKNISNTAVITCIAKGYPLREVKWYFKNDILGPSLLGSLGIERNSTRHGKYEIHDSLVFPSVRWEHNGTYTCDVDGNSQEERTVDLLVVDKPVVQINYALGVGKREIYVNWTVVEWNEKVKTYFIKVMKEGTDTWQFLTGINIPGNATSYVIENLDPGSTYNLQIEAKNELGSSVDTVYNATTTLTEDPVFTPKVSAGGGTSTSISISWTAPPEEQKYLLGYYVVKLVDMVSNEEKEAVVYSQKQHLFENLKPARNYTFYVQACNVFTKKCGNWSVPAVGTTIDGESGPPGNVQVECKKGDTRLDSDFITVRWDPPAEPNGKIIHYQLRLTGEAVFYDELGNFRRDDFGPMTGIAISTDYRFLQVPANTKFHIQVSGTTNSKKSGLTASGSCQTGPSAPNLLDVNKVGWSRVRMSISPETEFTRMAFKVNIPRLSERWGEVCCYRIILVKLSEGKGVPDLPEPEKLQFGFYSDVLRNRANAYLAEILDRRFLDRTILVGDGTVIDRSDRQCQACRNASLQTSVIDDIFGNEILSVTTSDSKQRRNVEESESVLQDDPLDKSAMYSGFLEVLVRNPVNDSVFSVFSNYFQPMTTIPGPGAGESRMEHMPLVVALAVLSCVAVLLLIFVVALLLLRRYGKRASEGAHDNMSLSGTCRFIMRQLRDGRTLLTSHEPLVSVAPIPKDEILAAFLERRKDSDYGFQEEFEMLPDRFPDRTTKASDAFENLCKNRYPDIKAYDQTRVKLFPVLGSTDYINANLVTGYKERKKFICAQGPMESTVQDFWRMIWEQRVEIIVMLTNLEEYNKTKCFRYWPEPEMMSAGNSNTIYSVPDPETPNTTPSNGTLNSDHVVIDVEQKPVTKGREKVFGDVKVLHVKQSRYADYLIRELQVSRPKTPSPRSPTKEKPCPIYQNTLIEDIEPEESELEREVRPVFQYHFIVWKDFQAPEYPHSILKFIKRLNEDYSPERGPILVHCSAGVGRTGSLVAIDSLLQQINEEGCVSIFNTIADLRHQRNFLVQSLKQYIFVYRSLMEYVMFGETEIEAFKLAEHLEKLKRTDSEDRSKCLLEQEFERLSLVIEERKPCTVSSSDECTSRNRNQSVIPYDRNRVILVPVPHKEQSTYINASFIESYDNRESFIVTQDPLESTMYDFWRMVVGHEISTIVMLSDFEVDESSCPRYWPEDNQEVTFECVTVKHTHTSTKPVYIKRDFVVTNTKTREEIKASQLQYLAWPSEGEDDCVPDPSQLETFVQFAIDSLALHERLPNPGPMCVHCSTGSTRSSVLLALCILIQQARTEGRIDVFSVVRKLRSQRPGMISHYNHYKFVYEAISSYVSTYPQDLC